MTVAELIRELESMPQNAPVLAEGEEADKVVMENCQGDICVRIFKAWDVDFFCRDEVIKDLLRGQKERNK